jgi:hypothetical protein
LPAAAATTVTLAHVPDTVVVVARGGIVQSQTAGHYSRVGAVLTFASAFSGSERVVVGYAGTASSGTGGLGIDTELRTYIMAIMSTINPGGPPPPPP